jgi:hypothetical protein
MILRYFCDSQIIVAALLIEMNRPEILHAGLTSFSSSILQNTPTS